MNEKGTIDKFSFPIEVLKLNETAEYILKTIQSKTTIRDLVLCTESDLNNSDINIVEIADKLEVLRLSPYMTEEDIEINKRYPYSLLSERIKYIKWSSNQKVNTRIINLLEKNKIYTVMQLIRRSDEQISVLGRVGTGVINAIKEKLKVANLRLGMNQSDIVNYCKEETEESRKALITEEKSKEYKKNRGLLQIALTDLFITQIQGKQEQIKDNDCPSRYDSINTAMNLVKQTSKAYKDALNLLNAAIAEQIKRANPEELEELLRYIRKLKNEILGE